jgi:hypothetical protein
MQVVVSTEVLARLALAPAADNVHHALVTAGMAPDLVHRILEEDDTPQVGDWRAERCLVLDHRAPGTRCTVSHETGVSHYPVDYLRGLPLVAVECYADVCEHKAAML